MWRMTWQAMSLTDIARHVIPFHSTRETRVYYSVKDDVVDITPRPYSEDLTQFSVHQSPYELNYDEFERLLAALAFHLYTKPGRGGIENNVSNGHRRTHLLCDCSYGHAETVRDGDLPMSIYPRPGFGSSSIQCRSRRCSQRPSCQGRGPRGARGRSPSLSSWESSSTTSSARRACCSR